MPLSRNDLRASSAAPRRRRAAVGLRLLIGLALFAIPALAQEPAKTREQLEQEIAERQQALDQLEAEQEAAERAAAAEAVTAAEVAKETPLPPAEVEESPQKRRRHRHGDPDVMFTGTWSVEEGESAPGAVVLGGFLEVAKGGTVEGDATVVGGGAEVAGEVAGTLVVVGGSVDLKDGAVIGGDVVSIGGRIHESGDTRIDGRKVQIAFGDFGGFGTFFSPDWGFGPTAFSDLVWGFSVIELIGRFFRVGLLLVVVFAVVWLAPGRTSAIAARVRGEPWRSGLIGLIAEVVFLPIFLLVCLFLLISIIGIPLLVVVPPLLLLALLAFFVMGYCGVAMATGGILERRFDRRFSTFALLLFGLLLIEGWSLAGEVLLYLPGPIKLMALLALAFGFFVQYVAWTIGLGAAISEQVERRRLRFAEPGPESGLVDHLDAQ